MPYVAMVKINDMKCPRKTCNVTYLILLPCILKEYLKPTLKQSKEQLPHHTVWYDNEREKNIQLKLHIFANITF